MKATVLKTFVLLSFLVATGLVSSGDATADVNVNIGIGLPPPPNVVITAPPAVFPMPDIPVYFAPEVGLELFFYSGHWYLFQDSHWYRAYHYNGPWKYVVPARVPVVFHRLPPNYHRHYRGKKLIPYGQLKKHWRAREAHYRYERRGPGKWDHGPGKKWKEDNKKWKGEKHGKGRD